MVEQIVKYLSGKTMGKDLALTDIDPPNGGPAPSVVWARIH
jgi:hypothetical protein